MTPAERRAESIERLNEATRALQTSDGFRAWIKARQAFHDYSFGNQLLIACQQPCVKDAAGVPRPVADAATRVAGFKAWQKLDRQVVKGAYGIRIMAPIIVKDRDRPDDEDARKVFFKTVAVFDISQTDGEPLPEAPAPTGSIAGTEHDELYRRMLAFAAELGYSVELEAMPDGRKGYCSTADHRIALDKAMSSDEYLRVLTHEIAHALGIGYAEYGRERAEVIVEAASCVALDALGFDTSGESLSYLAQWAGTDLDAIRADAERIHDIASQIEAAMEPEKVAV